jgi:hypothetical protein
VGLNQFISIATRFERGIPLGCSLTGAALIISLKG